MLDGSRIDQSHRHGRPQAACREPAGSYDKTTRTAICFEHKTQYLLIHAPYTRIVVFWHISNLPPLFRRVKLVVMPPRFIEQQYLWNIAIQPAVGCYKPWANLRCSGCYPLGEKLLWNRSIMNSPWWFMGPTWGPSGADRTQVGPMLAPWTLLSGVLHSYIADTIFTILLQYFNKTNIVNQLTVSVESAW